LTSRRSTSSRVSKHMGFPHVLRQDVRCGRTAHTTPKILSRSTERLNISIPCHYITHASYIQHHLQLLHAGSICPPSLLRTDPRHAQRLLSPQHRLAPGHTTRTTTRQAGSHLHQRVHGRTAYSHQFQSVRLLFVDRLMDCLSRLRYPGARCYSYRAFKIGQCQ
jgi:hypothetical protein